MLLLIGYIIEIMKAAVSHREELIKILKDSEEASAYLNAALEAGDPKAFLVALRNVLEAQGGMTKISRRAKVNRVTLYKMLSRKGNPGFGHILNILKIVGIRFRATPHTSPKLGKKAA